MKAFLTRFFENEAGATAIEYGLIAAILSVGVIAGLQTIKTNLNTTYTNVGGNLA